MLVFRTNASPATGFGHLKRSAYLASMLKKKHGILFCVNKDKGVSRFLDELGIPFCLINKKGIPWEKDIRGILFDLREFLPADIQLLQQAKEKGIPTIQLTDLGLSQQPVDIVFDGAIDTLFPYPEANGDGTPHVCSGPDYLLLHHRFRHFNKLKRKYRKKKKNLLVSLGGGTQYRKLRKIIHVLSCQGYNVKVAAGFYLKKNSRKTLQRIYPRVRFVGDTDNLARAFYEADAAVITSGTAAAEAASVGTPALYLYYHKEQQFIAQSYRDKGAGLVISNIDDVISDPLPLLKGLDSLTFEKRILMGEKGKGLVDALGTHRVLEVLHEQGILNETLKP
ncbi:MAG: hypothetical protein GY765_15880 [bacterium]|nr:hypothetical protein [bacterium]